MLSGSRRRRGEDRTGLGLAVLGTGTEGWRRCELLQGVRWVMGKALAGKPELAHSS